MSNRTEPKIAPDLAPLRVSIACLEPMPGNPRRGDVDAVARSYAQFGQRKPIVVRRTSSNQAMVRRGVVIAGNHQLAAAKVLGWDELAVVWTDDDDATAKAFALADNRTADLGSYDDVLLAEMLQAVQEFPDLAAATGYSDDDLAALLASATPPAVEPDEDADPDEVPEPPPAKTVKGDVWLLGPHRIMCGDCREPTDVDRLLAGVRVNLAFTSPPYAAQRTYDGDSGFRPIPPDEYVEWFAPVAANVAAHLADDGSWFVNIKEHAEDGQRVLYVKDLTLAHVRDWGWRFVDEFCWTRNSVPGGWNNRFKNAWEPVFHLCRAPGIKFRPAAVALETDAAFSYSPDNPKSKTGFFSNRGRPDLATPGMAYPSNVLKLGVETRQTDNHSAPFPVGLPEWFVKAYTDPGDHVYDPFMGSGSTLIAAHRQNRVGYGMEISPRYVDVICHRFQEHTGIVPINEATGRQHDFTADADR